MIQKVDRFILLDAVQYIRHGWINRNRVLKPTAGWQYIILPLQSHSQTDTISKIRYMNLPDNREKILRQLEHYKRRAPFYNECRDVVAASLSLDTDQVTLVNANALACCNNYIGLNTPVDLGSKLSLQYNYIKHAGQWAVTISSQLQASTYINPVDGASLFVEEEFLAAGVQLNFLKAQLPVYDQRRDMFEPSLSIIDVMMFNDSTAINQMLNDCIIC